MTLLLEPLDAAAAAALELLVTVLLGPDDALLAELFSRRVLNLV